MTDDQAEMGPGTWEPQNLIPLDSGGALPIVQPVRPVAETDFWNPGPRQTPVKVLKPQPFGILDLGGLAVSRAGRSFKFRPWICKV